jgi:NAD(P)-dependent dehydrogenase (short-subunit alcohol dehydrogenase family)
MYGASKAALDLASRTLAGELRVRGVAVVSVDPGDMRTRLHQEAFAGQDISDRPLPEVTAPFWHWLFDQDPLTLSGQRFAAQTEDARWLQPL